MAKRRLLRRLLGRDGLLVAPGAYDALSARIIQQAGFEAVYVTGFGTSASVLGKPDLGLLTLNEMITHARNINAAVALPIIADGESGFGNALNVRRTVQEFERAGIAGIHIEDQMVPKRYRPDGKPQVVPMTEHVDKIRAAVDARENADFLIIARTDALGRHGIDEAIRRGNAYAEAGADMVFVHGAKDTDDLQRIVNEVAAPQLANYSTLVEGGTRPIPTIPELETLGVKLVILAGELLFAAARAMNDFLKQVRDDKGVLGPCLERLMPLPEFFGLMDWQAYTDMERQYLPRSETPERTE